MRAGRFATAWVGPVRPPETAARIPWVRDVLRSPGRSLEPDVRSRMEARFGHDFRQVRVHSDSEAANSAALTGALAYTAGSHIVFGQGRYQPYSRDGERLLAHELAHVVQQQTPSAGEAGTPEFEARQAGEAVANHQPLPALSGQPPSLQRQEATEEGVRRWMGPSEVRFRSDPSGQLDPEILRIQNLLDPLNIRSSLLQLDLDTILDYEPPPWLTAPAVPEEEPLVPRGAGPETPRTGNPGDILRAVAAVPVVDAALTRLKAEAIGRVRRDWRSLSTGEAAAVITHGVVIGGGALAGVLSDPDARRFALDLLQHRELPAGVPGLTWRFQLVGDNPNIMFHLNVGSLLPQSWGFR